MVWLEKESGSTKMFTANMDGSSVVEILISNQPDDIVFDTDTGKVKFHSTDRVVSL